MRAQSNPMRGIGFIQMMILLAASAVMPLGGIIMDAYGIVDGMRLLLTARSYEKRLRSYGARVVSASVPQAA